MNRIAPLLVLVLVQATTLWAQSPESLKKALAPLHEQYDPAQKMLKVPFRSPGYHTTLKGGMVHPTRDALMYAVACLATDEPDLARRACDVIDRVISLQDQNPASKTYGIWSWFLEEPLDKMSPPDWNWADFNGRSLLQVRLRYWNKIPAELQRKIDDSILHAARSIQRRNMGPGYTNIAVMGTYVTLVAAETYANAELKQYAMKRLQTFRDYTARTGGFSEYNSPTYTIVTLTCLGLLRHDAKDESARAIADGLYRQAWEEIANHFHAPTRQWAGPHGRCYSTLLRPSVLAIIQAGTQGRVDLGQAEAPAYLEAIGVPLPCPAGLERSFVSLDQPRQFIKTFVQSDNPIIGTTWLEPAFTLSSINRGDLWNQRRALLAYWGSASEPAYLHLRLLKDGYDFAAGQFFAAQDKGRVLAGINFATDGGDTHISLTRIKEGQFKAKELRLRFELGGSAKDANIAVSSKIELPAQFKIGAVHFRIAAPVAPKLSPMTVPHWQFGKDPNACWVDLVLHSGNEHAFDLKRIERAAIALAVSLSTDAAPPDDPSTTEKDGRLLLKWDRLQLNLPIKPDKAGALQKSQAK